MHTPKNLKLGISLIGLTALCVIAGCNSESERRERAWKKSVTMRTIQMRELDMLKVARACLGSDRVSKMVEQCVKQTSLGLDDMMYGAPLGCTDATVEVAKAAGCFDNKF